MFPIKHYGDIVQIKGNEVPAVDVITGGSPCQDLSVAGKRAGLAGERSGLFMEQMRIVKEMRYESRRKLEESGADFSVCDIKPRYLIWENVPGAYSSGNPAGADFQAVLEEIARVVLNEVPTIPIPEDGWPYAGNIEGVAEDDTPFSVSWRTHDAQYWGKSVIDNSSRVVKAGTPQRRRRIALVADFGGYTAPEILFECEGLSRNSEQSSKEGQGVAGTTGSGSEKSSKNDGVTAICIGNGQVDNAAVPEVELSKTLNCMQDPMKVLVSPTSENLTKTFKKDSHAKTSEDGQGWVETEVNDTLNAFDNGEMRTPTLVYENHSQDTRYKELGDVCTTVSATFGMGGNNTPFVVEEKPNTIAIEGNGTRDSHLGDGYKESDVMYTLNTTEQHAVCTEEPILLESNQNHATIQTDGVSTTLPASMGEGGGYVPMVVEGCDVKGLDAYNQASTGDVAMPLTNAATDPHHIPCVYGFEPGAAQRLDPENRFNDELAPTLRANAGDNQVAVVNVEMEVSVRKYEVDTPKLIECLQAHRKNKSVTELAEILNKPKTLVEHWFRKDKYFAIPDADIWMQLKELLQIDTDEFDKSIMTFETKPGVYDTGNRIHMGVVTPTLTAQGENTLYCVDQKTTAYGIDQQGGKGTAAFSEDVAPTMASDSHGTPHAVCYGMSALDSNSMKSANPHSGIYEADTSRTLDLNGGNPACNQGGMMVVQPTSDKPVKESTKAYGVTTKGNGDAFISEERHTALSTGGGEPGQGYPCVLTEQATPVGCLNPWEHQGKHIQSEDGIAETLYAGESRYGGGEAYVLQTKTTYQDTNDMGAVKETPVQCMEVFHCTTEDDKAHPLKARDYKDPQVVAIDMGVGKSNCGVYEEMTPPIVPTHGGEPVVYGFKPDQGAKAQGMGFEQEKAPTLNTSNNAGVVSIENHPNDSRVKIRDDGTVQTLSGRMGTGGNNTPMVMENKEILYATTRDTILRILSQTYGEKEIIQWGTTVLASLQQAEILQPGVYESRFQSEAENWDKLDDHTLPRPELVAYWLLRDMRKQQECGCSPQGWESSEQHQRESSEIVQKLSHQSASSCKDLFNMWSQGESIRLLRETLSKIQEVRKPLNDQRQPILTRPVVRRLTPLECTRLQGFPDGWVDIGDWTDSNGKLHKDSDSAKYKALGNSIALPFWYWMSGRMVNQLKKDGVEQPTMASLFDGISGFPLVFAQHGCTPLWSSEIEEFPIAVAKKHFGDDETGTPGDYEKYINDTTPFYLRNLGRRT